MKLSISALEWFPGPEEKDWKIARRGHNEEKILG